MANLAELLAKSKGMRVTEEAPAPPAATQPTNPIDNYSNPNQPDKLPDTAVGRLQEAIGILRSTIDDESMVSNALNNIVRVLQENRELTKILQPEDFQLMIRGLRESRGVHIAVAEKKKAKKTTKTKKESAFTIDFDLPLEDIVQ